jgi:hypothetical protein
MVIHLILLSVDTVHSNLLRSVEVVSDCLRALWRVTDLPPYRIPSCCKHSDILKNILVNCWGLSFTTYYSHMKAHQDDSVSFANLSQKSQLNCICDHTAKQQIAINGLDSPSPGCMFLLEPIGIFVNGAKMTSDTGEQLRSWAHCQLARSYYYSQRILSHEQFDEIDWLSVRRTLKDFPQLFQLWATKHVNNIAGMMTFLSHQDGRCKLCPSCQTCEETCQHVAQCTEVGRMLAFKQSSRKVERWLDNNNTQPDMQHLLLQYLRGCSLISCLYCATALELPPIMQELEISQDTIGWDHFMMGMVSRQFVKVQSAYLLRCNPS